MCLTEEEEEDKNQPFAKNPLVKENFVFAYGLDLSRKTLALSRSRLFCF